MVLCFDYPTSFLKYWCESDIPLCKEFITFKDVFKGIFLKGVLRNIDDADVLSEKFCDSLLKESEEEKRFFLIKCYIYSL